MSNADKVEFFKNPNALKFSDIYVAEYFMDVCDHVGKKVGRDTAVIFFSGERSGEHMTIGRDETVFRILKRVETTYFP